MKTFIKKIIEIIYSYILNEIRPPPVAVTCALEILIRLVRHSPITALKMINSPNLLETIIKHFMPLSTDALGSYICVILYYNL